MSKPSLEFIILNGDSDTLFGDDLSRSAEERRTELENKYRGYSLVLPVDAAVARQKLESLYAEAKRLLERQAPPIFREPATRLLGGRVARTITSPPEGLKHARTLWQDSLCGMLDCRRELDGQPVDYTVRMPLFDEDGEFIRHEARILSKLGADKPTNDPFHGHFRRYLPTMLGTFATKLGDQEGYRIEIMFEDLESFRTLFEVREAFPDGAEFQTAVWMFNRLLEGLGYAHNQLVIHGGLVPCNILVRPSDHAAKLLGWNGSVVDPAKTFDHIGLMHDDYREFYPPEVTEKLTPTPATDIFMAAKCMVYVLGGDTKTDKMPDSVPDYLQNFLKSCLIARQSGRPNDAWVLRREFDEFMRSHYGPPKFHKFEMPPRERQDADETEDER